MMQHHQGHEDHDESNGDSPGLLNLGDDTPPSIPSTSSIIAPTNYFQSSVLPNRNLTYIGAANFPLWLQHKLSRKYFFHLDRLLMTIKPAVMLLKDARTALEEIGVLVRTKKYI